MFIEVYYDNSDEAMYSNDPDAIDAIDYDASETAFEAKLQASLKAQYPDAQIIIRAGAGQYRVNGATGSDDAIDVGEIVHQVWQAFDWIRLA